MSEGYKSFLKAVTCGLDISVPGDLRGGGWSAGNWRDQRWGQRGAGTPLLCSVSAAGGCVLRGECPCARGSFPPRCPRRAAQAFLGCCMENCQLPSPGKLKGVQGLIPALDSAPSGSVPAPNGTVGAAGPASLLGAAGRRNVLRSCHPAVPAQPSSTLLPTDE